MTKEAIRRHIINSVGFNTTLFAYRAGWHYSCRAIIDVNECDWHLFGLDESVLLSLPIEHWVGCSDIRYFDFRSLLDYVMGA